MPLAKAVHRYRFVVFCLVGVSLLFFIHVNKNTFVFAATPGMDSGSYTIEFDSLNSAGLDTSVSSSYGLLDTVGEVGTGFSASASYGIRAGYRQMNNGQISITTPGDVIMTSLSGITADTSTGSVTWTVTTDNPDGYELSIRSSTNPALQDTSEGNVVDNYTPATSNPDFSFSIANSTAEFGFSPEGDDVAQRFLDNGSSCNTGTGETADRCWDAFSTSDVVISTRATSNQVGGTDTTVKLQAENGSSHIQEAGTYEAVITVTAVTL